MHELDVSAIRIDHDSQTPPFEQVRAHIAGLIARSELSPATKLPTVRRLAEQLGLAVNTAARVYRELEGDGLVTTRGRRGTFVRSALTERTSPSRISLEADEAARNYVARVRRLGLTRPEAIQLVDTAWEQ